MRRTIILLVSIAVSALFLWLALRGLPLDEVWNSIQTADIVWTLGGIVFTIGALWTRSVRWRGLLGGRITPTESFHILNIAMLLNQLPLRAGEVARSILVTRSGVPLVTAATSIVVERLLDLLMVVILLAVSLSVLPNAPEGTANIAALMGVASVSGFIVLILLSRYPGFVHRILTWIEARVPLVKRLGLGHRLEEVLDGLHTLTDLRRAAHAVTWTLIGWANSLAVFYCLCRALSIENIDPVLAGALTVPLVALSIALPVSVAGLGPFQGAVRVGGDALGIPAVLSTSLGFLFHGVTVLTYAIMGVIGLLALGVSLGDLTRAATTDTAARPDAVNSEPASG